MHQSNNVQILVQPHVQQTIHIVLDPSCDIERMIIDHALPHDIIKRMFVIGYTLCASHVDMMDEMVRECMKEHAQSEIVRRFHSEIQGLKEENLQLIASHEKSCDALKSRFALELENKNLKVEHLQKLLHESERKSQEVFQETFKDSVQHLRDMLREKDMQMQLLKSTNASKGIIGESKIMDALKNIYQSAEVTYTGKTPHSCDIKLCIGDESMYVFESKYKGHIAKEDITKFQYDIEQAKGCISGGVFVSILSKNIPGKGCFHMECIGDENTPVLYIGYENEAEFDLLFGHHVRMFMQLAKVMCDMMGSHVHRDNETDTEVLSNAYEQLVQRVVADIMFYSDMLKKNKKRLDELKTRFTKYYQEVESDQYDIMKRVDALLDSLQPSGVGKHSVKHSVKPSQQETYTCTSCSKVFTSSRGLSIHTNTCKQKVEMPLPS